METLLIATRNFGKATEFKAMFEPRGYMIETLHDYPDLAEVEETGKTFAENALLKAETIAKLTNQMVIGDDSGLLVDALDGAPGIYSARYAGKDHDDQANNAKLLAELEGVEWEKRTAHFQTTLAVAHPQKDSLVVEGKVYGYILEEPRGHFGFGYDPLFYYPELNKSFGELEEEEKNQVSHRSRALKALDLQWDEWMVNDL